MENVENRRKFPSDNNKRVDGNMNSSTYSTTFGYRFKPETLQPYSLTETASEAVWLQKSSPTHEDHKLFADLLKRMQYKETIEEIAQISEISVKYNYRYLP